MSNLEYKTTMGNYTSGGADFGGGRLSSCGDDPVPPEGEGWRLLGTCAVDGNLIWTWVRAVID